MQTTNSKYLIKLTLVATLGGLLFGYDTGVISGTVGSLESFFVNPKGLSETAASAFKGFLVASALIGCIIGGIFGGLVSKKLGRKKGLVLAAILFLISALGSSMPEMFIKPIGELDHTFSTIFIVYRIIGGVGVGLASMLSPLYIAEIAPAKSRGKLVSFNQLAIVGGFMVVYFVNYFISKGGGSDEWLNEIGWRWMFASEVIPAGLFLGLLFFVPDTPRSLMLKNKPEEALDVLVKVNGEEEGKKILAEIEDTVAQSSGKLLSYGWLIIIIGIALSVFQQFVGINVVLYYAPEIFKTISSGTDSALLMTIIVGVVNFLFTIIAVKTVDSYGRKPLMLIGALGMAVAMISLGFVFFSGATGYLALACMMLYVGSFAVSWGPVVWVLLSEIFPNKIRGKAMAVAVAAQWISNYLVSFTFPMMNDNSNLTELFNHGFAYWVYGLMSLLAMYFVWKWVPETKGKTLEEMEGLWKKDYMKQITRRRFVKTAVVVIAVAALGTKLFASVEEKQSCTLWQLPEQTKSQMNSYVIQTIGNELIVIDGGTKGDAAYLRKFIRDRGNHVHAWFISHPHLDHVDALTAILNNPEDMKIDKIYGSLPDDAWMEKHQNAHADETQLQLKVALKKSKRKLLDLSPGQKIKFTGVTFEVLSTLNPELTTNAVNNQSAVWRVDSDGGKSILFLGDFEEEGGEKLLASSYRNRLKADYVQMSHHGQQGVSEEFYKVVDPDYCLWPTPKWLWDNDKGEGKNSGPWKTLEVRAWMDKLNIKKHYVAKDGLQRIDF